MRKKPRRRALMVAYIAAVGGNAAAAERLGICPHTLNNWLYMRSKLRVGGASRGGGDHGGGMSRVKARHAMLELAKVTGQNVQKAFRLTRDDMRRLEDGPIQATPYAELIRERWDTLVPWYAAVTREHLIVPPDTAGVEHKALCEAVAAVLDTLQEREREIIAMRYGLRGHFPLTLHQVGIMLGLTRERVRQLEARAVRRLQQPYRAAYLVGFHTYDKD